MSGPSVSRLPRSTDLYLDLFLRNFVAANPSKSAYGFTFNRKRPGHFNLCYLANKNSTVQTWVSIPHVSMLPRVLTAP